VKTISEMTYTVLGGALNSTQSHPTYPRGMKGWVDVCFERWRWSITYRGHAVLWTSTKTVNCTGSTRRKFSSRMSRNVRRMPREELTTPPISTES